MVGVAWGLAGLLGLLVFAVYRLGGVVVAGMEYTWTWQHVAAAVANAAFMAWSEGLRGLPAVVLASCGRTSEVAAGSSFGRSESHSRRCSQWGYFGATRERLIGIYALTAGIVVLIVGGSRLASTVAGGVGHRGCHRPVLGDCQYPCLHLAGVQRRSRCDLLRAFPDAAYAPAVQTRGLTPSLSGVNPPGTVQRRSTSSGGTQAARFSPASPRPRRRRASRRFFRLPGRRC